MSAPYPYPNWKEPLERFCKQADWTTNTLNMLGNGGSMGSFKYSSFGAHLLSSEYIQQSITPFYSKPVYLTFNYGYLWWLREFHGHSAFLAVGDGGNTICCIPDCKLVVAVTAKHLGIGKEVDFPSIIEALI